MMETRIEFRRMVVRLPLSKEDYGAVGMTARLAEQLGLQLLAMFVEDTTLAEIAGLPCVRELRFFGGWSPIEEEQLGREIAQTAAIARRLFQEAVQESRIEASFAQARGSIAEVIGSLATEKDIIVIIEPKHPAERVTAQFAHLVDVAFQTAAAVLIVPHRIARVAGPVVAVVSSANDPSIRTALGIAAAAREPMLVLGTLEPEAQAQIAEQAKMADVPVKFISVPPQPLDAPALLAALSHLNERLVVIQRGIMNDVATSQIASARRIPVLVIEPEAAGQSGK